MSNKELNVSDLDFDDIKYNLKLFFENQDSLKDYNFNGSVINILMDALSYITHYNAIYANQSLNETFLDTSILRNNIVSRAKELGYIPRQYISAFVAVTITVNVPLNDTRVNFEIPSRTKFTGEKDGKTYNFTTVEQTVLDNKVGNAFTGEIILREGTFVEDEFIFNSSEVNPRFVLTPEQIDTNFTTVEVFPFDDSANKEVFETSETIIDLDSESNAYFFQENNNGDIEIYFGDGIIGRKLSNGNKIRVTSFMTSGSDGNGISSFGISQSIGDINRSNIIITTTDHSLAGSDRESEDSIKFLSPRLYTVQNRLVTNEDYRSYILKNFGNIQSINVWDGAVNVPKFYGRVFISIKPKGSDVLSNYEKNQILENINSKGVTGISQEIVDPEILYVNIFSTISFDRNKTTFFSEQFESLAKEAISDYFLENISELGGSLVYSQLVGKIDDANDAIVGNLTEIELNKKFIPRPNSSTYLFDFGNPIRPGSVKTNIWTDTFDDFYISDESGVLVLYRNDIVLNTTIGNVDYSSGLIELFNFVPSITENTSIVINVKPTSNNINSLRNNILVNDQITVRVTDDEL